MTFALGDGQKAALVGVNGAGKTTAINIMKEELGVKKLIKSMTRGYRSEQEEMSGDVRKVSSEYFQQYRDNMFLRHEYSGSEFAIDYADLFKAMNSQDNYVFDTVDIEGVLKFRDQFPQYVKVILLLTPPELTERGLIYRAEDLKKREVWDQYHDTQRRLKGFAEECEKLKHYREYVDHCIEVDNYEGIDKRLNDIVV